MIGRGLLRLAIVLGASAALGAAPTAARAGDLAPRASATPAAFRAASTCAPCHPAIHDEWRQSAMARSVELAGWSLRSSLQVLAAQRQSEEIRELCYACHAPFARPPGTPLALAAPEVHEGVGCDYCHSLRAVEASPAINVATVVPGDVKTGPHADAASPAHGTLGLALMRRSELCAGCHWFAWPATGMPIDWTYPQWAASPYRAAGIECQSCHMPRRAGPASTLAGAPDRGGHASHAFPGARDLPTLRAALDLRARREGGRVRVEVANVGAGHNVPGGGGELRALELRLVPGALGEAVRRRFYRVRYFDEDGEPVSGSDDGAVRFEDGSIRPRETRVELLDLPRAIPARVELHFWYVSEEVAARDGTTPASALVATVPLPAEP